MKKILFNTVLFSVVTYTCLPAVAINYSQAPNGGNMNFYPMMQRQMEKQETLDFVNNPEEYDKKREEKEKSFTNQNPELQLKPTRYDIENTRRVPFAPASMQFTRDENGKIRIQGVN